MLKRASALFILILILIYPLSVFANEIVQIQNSGFETTSDKGISGWNKSVWDNKDGVSEMRLDNKVYKTGSQSALIINNSSNDARYTQQINVKGDSLYKITCWVKTENVGASNKGANISVDGLTGTSSEIKETSDGWKQLELFGKTEKSQESFVLTLGLGGYGSTNTGKAWFDDVYVEKIDSLPSGVSSMNLYTDTTSSGQANTPDKNILSYLPYVLLVIAIVVIIFFLVRKVKLDTKNKAITDNKINRNNPISHVNKPGMDTKKAHTLLYSLIGIGVLTRIIFAVITKGHPIDMGCFKAWAFSAANNLTGFYNSGTFTDYPPLYIYVLSIIGNIMNIFNLGAVQWAQGLLVKLPSMLADLVTAYLLFRLCCKYLNNKWGLVIACIYVFNPVVLLNSSIWGQVDSFFTMFIVFALLLLNSEKVVMASVVFTAAVLVKPQGLIFLPVLFFELVKLKKIKNFLLSFAAALGSFILIILPFSFNQHPLWIFKLYMKTLSEYPYASLNAYNLFSLLGSNWAGSSQHISVFGAQTPISYQSLGYISIALITSFVIFLYLKGKSIALPAISALFLITGVFVLSSGMHERYMFPAMALALMVYIYVKDIRLLFLYAAISITGFINTFVVYEESLKKVFQIPSDNFLLKFMSFINVLILIYLTKVTVDIVLRNKLWIPVLKAAATKNKKKLTQK